LTQANTTKQAIKTRLQGLPEKPGVYRYYDANHKVIYVGKAKVLKNRVRSYFTNKRLDAKTMQLVSQIADFDYIVTDSEQEALLLETTLIKQYRPKYNVVFKDDKSLPFIQVTVQEKYPRVLRTRKVENDGSRYFGPYSAGGSVFRTLTLIERLFPLCSKPERIEGKQERPCLQYYIHRCMGACAGKADPDEYRAAVQEVLLFLEGKHEQLIGRMRAQMEEAAEHLRFEQAAYLRDRLNDLTGVLARQKVVLPQAIDMDVVALAAEQEEACAEVLFVRQGKLLGHEHYVMKNAEGESPEVIEQSFVEQFYTTAATIPKLLLVQHELPDPEPVRELLELKRGSSIEIHVPKRGEKKALLDMAIQNAKEGLEQERFKWLSDEQKRTGALTELQAALSLPSKPHRIECFDISNAQGTNTVASMVVFENGGPARSEYRRFQIKTVEGSNDFESMREALTRRFKRAASAAEEDAKWTKLPDLLVIDGGKGQLGVAVEVLRAAGLGELPVIGLAKQQEEIFRPGRSESLLLSRNSEALYLLQRIRDEAHRFAITYHRDLRSKKSVKSPLDEVAGVGPKRKKALIKAFGSVAGIRAASVDEVAAVPGIDRVTAERVKERI
jgi:excinuclease ABC subunit C